MLSPVRLLLSASAIATFGLSSCASQASERAVLAADTLPAAEQIIAPWLSEEEPGVAVAVSWDDEVVFARGAGLANLEHRVPIGPDSVFQVASVSKQFTAFAVFLLVSEGRIDLDADIRTFLPELPVTEPVITVRHLLDHTGGLRERNTLANMAGWMADDIHTRAQLLELVVRQKGVNFPAGAEIEYSNTGYGLLAEIVARVSGQSFSAFMQQRVFTPLGMIRTRFPESRNALIENRALSYYPSGESFGNVVSASEATGSTGLYTSALDLLEWAANFRTRRVGDAQVLAMMEERFEAANGDASTFGRGQERRVYNGLVTWSHGGRDAGYRSFLLRVPDKAFAVAILSNRTDFDTAEMAFALLDVFLQDDPDYEVAEAQPWSPATPEQLAAYAGDYELYPGVIFAIRHENGGLAMAPLGASRAGLEPLPQVGSQSFLLSESPEQVIVFDAPIDGRSPALGLRYGLHGTLSANRVELLPFDPETVDLDDYTGRCHSDELDTFYDFTLRDGVLLARHPRLPAFSLSPYQTDIFAGAGALQKLEWVRESDGQISGLIASSSLAEGVQFACATEGSAAD